jgi:hypothetical protein
MRPDKTQEMLHVTEIMTGLEDIERCAFAKVEDQQSGLLALKMACKVFDNLSKGFLPMLYEIPKLKEVCLNVAGSMDLVRYFRRINDKSKVKTINKHLQLIGTAGFGVAATYIHQQGRASFFQESLRKARIPQLRSEILKDATRKTIELMMGMAALNSFEEVILEDLDCADVNNPNPDVIVRDGKKRFGIACKSVSSKSRPNFRERITEGIEQIDHAINKKRVDNRCGIVLVDVSALLDHDSLYVPQANSAWNSADISQVLQESIDKVSSGLFDAEHFKTLNESVGDLFEGHKAAPGVLLYAHSLMVASSEGVINPYYMKAMRLHFAGDTSKVTTFCEHLNRALHCQ